MAAPHLAVKASPRDAGDIIGKRLVLRRCVATGGMGSVWVARNLSTHAEVAVKILRPGVTREVEGAARFRHEARLGALLAHRNITRVYDLVEEDDGSLVLVMELLRGETLADYAARRGRLEAAEAVALMVPVLRGLAHAHEQGVVHRDLKPSNIFLHVDPDGQLTPKIIDFGVAKAAASSIVTRAGDALGTPGYMSPEQVRALDLDGRSDLFSAGIVLYQLLTGTNPFHSDTASAALARVLELEVDPDPAIAPPLWLELRRVLAKQPYVRHATANELADRLLAAVGSTEPGLAEHLKRERPPLSSHDHTVTSNLNSFPPNAPRPGGTVAVAEDEAAAPDSATRPTRPGLRRRWPILVVLFVTAGVAATGLAGLLTGPGRAASSPARATLPAAGGAATNVSAASSVSTGSVSAGLGAASVVSSAAPRDAADASAPPAAASPNAGVPRRGPRAPGSVAAPPAAPPSPTATATTSAPAPGSVARTPGF
ncbi:MAG: serine/threonine protein kinase [Labilithrix sp.]|nr:serine/threonine protein kinase [Labilithrix sp.]